MGSEHYNILQNNGHMAHQVVEHVSPKYLSFGPVLHADSITQAHFHVIPKPNDREGLGISWPVQNVSKSDLEQLADHFKAKLNKTSQ